MSRKIIQLFRNKTVYTSRSAMLSAIIKDDEGATFVGDQSLKDGEGIALRYKDGQKTITEYGLVFNDSNVKKIQLFSTYDEFKKLYDVVEGHTKTINSHNTTISNHSESIKTNTENITKNSTAISGLGTRLGKAETNIQGNTSSILALDKRITANGKSIDANASNISKNKTTIAEHESSITDLKNGVSTNGTEIKRLQGIIDGNTEKINANSNSISTNSSAIEANKNEIGNIKTALDSKISNITVNGTTVPKSTTTVPLTIIGESTGGTIGDLSKVSVSTDTQGKVTLASYVNVGTVPDTYGGTTYTDALAKTSHVKTYVESAINSLDSTKSSSAGNYISSITQKNGVITSVGSTPIPHHTARLSITQAAKGTEITSESGDHPWINLTENGVVQSLQLVGGNNMNITVDAKGHIQFDSSYTNTTYTAGTGIDISSTTISLETAGVGKLGGVKAESATVDSSWTKARINAGYVYYQDTDTHYKATHVLSKTQTGKVNESSESTGHPFLNIVENGSVTSSIQIIGQQGITTVVETADNGKMALLHIRGTVYSAGTGLEGTTKFSLKKATKTTLGGVIVGDGLSVSDGTISASLTSIGAAASSHSHPMSQVTGLETALNGKAPKTHSHTTSEITDLQTKLDDKLNASLKGAKSGLAELDANGKVPSSQLPSYVDDVLEYDAKTSFPTTGETGKIYIDKSTNKTYRWSGTIYTVISETLALGTTSSTAYYGNLGKIAYDHSQKTSGNPHNVTKADVGLGNVEDKSSATIRGELTKENIEKALKYIPPSTDTTYTLSGGNGTANVTLTPSSGTATTITINNVANAKTCDGNAATATKLQDQTQYGSAVNPVYFVGGKPSKCTYKLEASVPSNAVFTDTKYSAGNGLKGTSTFSVKIGTYTSTTNPGYMDDMLSVDSDGVHISNVIDCGTF